MRLFRADLLAKSDRKARPGHPERLAERVAWLLQNPDALSHGMLGVNIAQERFEYRQLARQLSTVFETVMRS